MTEHERGEPVERRIEVRRSARYYLSGGLEAPSELWFVCHGYRQLAGRFIRRFQPVAGPDRLVVAPEALSRFYIDDEPGPHGPESRVGATWMTREDRQAEIRDYVRYLDAVHHAVLSDCGVRKPRVVVLGFSQGTATATRWVTCGAVRPAELVLWAGLPAHDLDLERARERLAGVTVTVAFGDRDPFVTPATRRKAESWLERLGIRDARLVEYAGAHRVEPAGLRRLVE